MTHASATLHLYGSRSVIEWVSLIKVDDQAFWWIKEKADEIVLVVDKFPCVSCWNKLIEASSTHNRWSLKFDGFVGKPETISNFLPIKSKFMVSDIFWKAIKSENLISNSDWSQGKM